MSNAVPPVRETGRWFLEDYCAVQQFANRRNTTIAWLKDKAKEIKLRIWSGGRNGKNDRITFGLFQKPVTHITEHRDFSQDASVVSSTTCTIKINPRLFTWNIRKKDGLMQPGTCCFVVVGIILFCCQYVHLMISTVPIRTYRCVHAHAAENNNKNVARYFQYAAEYSASMSEVPRSVATMKKDIQETQVWLPEMVRILVEDRTKACPETYKTIAATLNRMYRKNDCPHRKFTNKDCQNKWYNMFPSSQDAVATVNYLKQMEKLWPGLKYKVEKIYSGTSAQCSPCLPYCVHDSVHVFACP